MKRLRLLISISIIHSLHALTLHHFIHCRLILATALPETKKKLFCIFLISLKAWMLISDLWTLSCYTIESILSYQYTTGSVSQSLSLSLTSLFKCKKVATMSAEVWRGQRECLYVLSIVDNYPKSSSSYHERSSGHLSSFGFPIKSCCRHIWIPSPCSRSLDCVSGHSNIELIVVRLTDRMSLKLASNRGFD